VEVGGEVVMTGNFVAEVEVGCYGTSTIGAMEN